MKRVTVVGMGLGNPDTLTLGAIRALEGADLLLGAPRMLDMLPENCRGRRIAAARPEDVAAALQNETEWQAACVALSGDVGLFSGARRLPELLAQYELRMVPGIGSAQYLAARLGVPWQGWRFASAHGVGCDVPSLVAQGGTVFFVTGGENTVGSLCAALCEAGLGNTRVTVGEKLSYPDERIVTGSAVQMAGQRFDGLSVMLVENSGPAPWPYGNTGIPDTLFQRGKTPMTKQEVRAAALAKLGVAPGDVVYDIGAGTGSVAVELALLVREGVVYAVEYKPEAAQLVRENARLFGACNLQVVQGRAPEALSTLPPPDAVFVGGSGGSLAEVIACVRDKNPGVRVCIACITLETLAEGARLLGEESFGECEICQISVSRSCRAGNSRLMKALNPVYLISAKGKGREK